LAEHLVFLDYLRANPTEALEYERRKRQLARQFRRDIGAYVEGKSALVERTLTRARRP